MIKRPFRSTSCVFAHVAPVVPVALAFIVLTAVGHAQLPSPAREPGTSVKSPAPPSATPADLPSARSILDRHLAAIGGRDAVLSHSSAHATGTLAMPAAGLTGTFDLYGAKPNKSLMRVTISGVGEVSEGFDGRYGWSMSPMTGPMLLEGRQLEEKRFDAEFHGELRSDSRYRSMTTLERTDFEGRRCYKLRLVRKTGGEDFEFYEVETGLKAGSITTRETQMGTVTGTTIESDYKRFGNLLQPTTVRNRVDGMQGVMEQVITIASVEYDTVPASMFELPAGIKALIK